MKFFFRKKYFIEKKLQTKFILFTILLMLVYTLSFVAILFIPYFIPLSSSYSLKEQTEAARMVLSLNTSIWPALTVVVLSLSFLSIFISHKIAGPIYRLKRSMNDIAAGNIAMDVKFRKRDELHDVAASVNLVIHELRQLVGALKNSQITVADCASFVVQQIEKQQISEDVGRKLVVKLQSSQQETVHILDKYPSD